MSYTERILDVCNGLSATFFWLSFITLFLRIFHSLKWNSHLKMEKSK